MFEGSVGVFLDTYNPNCHKCVGRFDSWKHATTVEFFFPLRSAESHSEGQVNGRTLVAAEGTFH